MTDTPKPAPAKTLPCVGCGKPIVFQSNGVWGHASSSDARECRMGVTQPAPATPAATPMAATTYRCKECGMIGQFPKNPFITPEEEAELAKLEAKGVKWVQSGIGAVAMNSEASQKLPAAAQPAATPMATQWVIVITGEGATARLANDANLRDELHRAWCVCGNPWSQCKTEGITDDIRKMDDDEEWFNDEDGQRFGMEWRGETGNIAIYKLTPAAAQPQRESEQPAQALREAAEWIICDAQYKAPEQIGLIAERWLARLRAAMSPQTDSQEPR